MSVINPIIRDRSLKERIIHNQNPRGGHTMNNTHSTVHGPRPMIREICTTVLYVACAWASNSTGVMDKYVRKDSSSLRVVTGTEEREGVCV